jgi:hypothetical protein
MDASKKISKSRMGPPGIPPTRKKDTFTNCRLAKIRCIHQAPKNRNHPRVHLVVQRRASFRINRCIDTLGAGRDPAPVSAEESETLCRTLRCCWWPATPSYCQHENKPSQHSQLDSAPISRRTRGVGLVNPVESECSINTPIPAVLLPPIAHATESTSTMWSNMNWPSVSRPIHSSGIDPAVTVAPSGTDWWRRLC